MVKTAAPCTSPLRKRVKASFAADRGKVCTCVRTGTLGASAKNSSPSRRVRFATEQRLRSSQRISYGNDGMSLVNSATHDDASFANSLERLRHQCADRRKNDGSIQRFGR